MVAQPQPDTPPDTPPESPPETTNAAVSDKIRHLRPLQQRFLSAYMTTFRVTKAAEQAGIARDTHYAWLAQDEKYRATFERTRLVAADVLEDEAFRRAMDGANDLLRFLLRGLRPERYGNTVKTVINNIANQSLLEEQERAAKALSRGGMVPAREHAIGLLESDRQIKEAFSEIGWCPGMPLDPKYAAERAAIRAGFGMPDPPARQLASRNGDVGNGHARLQNP